MHLPKPICLGCCHLCLAVPQWPDAGNTARVTAACFQLLDMWLWHHTASTCHARRPKCDEKLHPSIWSDAEQTPLLRQVAIMVSLLFQELLTRSRMRLLVTQAVVNFVATPEKVEKEAALSPKRAAPVMATMRATISRTAPTCSSSGRHAHSTLAMGPILGSKDLQVNAA